jgi:uncharacterized secreted protein with C-terminal beta-propeller domain
MEEKTVIHRISIDSGNINYEAVGEVIGRVLNRFSMDEFGGYFRIATTRGNVWSTGTHQARNYVFVLDMNLTTVGSVGPIAHGERIYSARFMGNRAYVVTFKKVDPFFVIDLSNPNSPRVLGELKIPGYSDYLHPYDENHVIGIGKDTHDMGSFAWYLGVKLSLFDVTDVNRPKEISKFIIGDRGTYSTAQSDPHAFLFSLKKNLLVIPIRLYEIDEARYPDGAYPSTMGVYNWNGAYVFDLTVEDGFKLKGDISHFDENEAVSRYYYRDNNKEIKRSFYIENMLYTYSDSKLKMNNLNNMFAINELEFSERVFQDEIQDR